VMHDIHLQYTRTEQDRLQDFITELVGGSGLVIGRLSR